MPAPLQFAEHALALHLLLQRPQRLVDIVVADIDGNDDALLSIRCGKVAKWKEPALGGPFRLSPCRAQSIRRRFSAEDLPSRPGCSS